MIRIIYFDSTPLLFTSFFDTHAHKHKLQKSATNFMIRDHKMVRLVSPDKEPITLFIRRVRDLREKDGDSSVIAVDGSGYYLTICRSCYYDGFVLLS